MSRAISLLIWAAVGAWSCPFTPAAAQYLPGNGWTGPVIEVIDGTAIKQRVNGAEIVTHLGFTQPLASGQICTDADKKPIPCGKIAAAKLVEILGGRPQPCPNGRSVGICLSYSPMVTCQSTSTRTGVAPATICLAGPIDLGQAMVAQGYAQAAGGAYSILGAIAKNEQRGLWAGATNTAGTAR